MEGWWKSMPSSYYSSSTVCNSISIQFRRKQNYMGNYLKPYKWTYLMRLFNLTSQATRELVILKLQTEFQNHGMYLQIHFYIILSVFPQICELLIVVILRYEMEMSTLIFTTNLRQILQEFLEM